MKPMFLGIGADGLVRPSVVDEIRLAVSLKIMTMQTDRTGHRALEDTGGPGFLSRIVGRVRMALLRQSHLD